MKKKLYQGFALAIFLFVASDLKANEINTEINQCNVKMGGYLSHGAILGIIASYREVEFSLPLGAWPNPEEKTHEDCLNWAMKVFKLETIAYGWTKQGGGRTRKKVRVFLYPEEMNVHYIDHEGSEYSEVFSKDDL